MKKPVHLPYSPDPSYTRKYDKNWPTLMQVFAESAEKFPNNLCFAVLDPQNSYELKYKDALEIIQKLATIFRQHTMLEDGDAIGLCGSNSPEWALSFFALACAGLTIIPLDVNGTVAKSNALCQRANVKFVIADQDLLDQGFGESSRNLNFSLDKNSSNYILNQIIPETPRMSIPAYSDETLAAILFTSGTTGSEKGVMLTHRNLVSDAYCLMTNISFTDSDMFYAILPIHHSYCMQSALIAPLLNGASIAFAKGVVITQMMKELSQNRITIIPGIPLLFNKLMLGIMGNLRKKSIVIYGLARTLMFINGLSIAAFNRNIGKNLLGFILKKANLYGVNLLISGGGPIASTTVSLFNQLGINFIQGYGLTETSPIVTLNPVNKNKYKSIGLPTDLTEIIIHEAGDDGMGEIAIKGPMVFEGYYQNPEATSDAFTSDGYFRSGDIGFIDKDGFVYITGRSKNIIVTEGGKNVSPEEVEDVFQLNPEVDQILVRSYIADESLKKEGIEAIIYPNQELLGKLSDSEKEEAILEIIRNGNRHLQIYQRITRVRLINTAMEVTGTKKIRRHTVEKETGKIILQ